MLNNSNMSFIVAFKIGREKAIQDVFSKFDVRQSVENESKCRLESKVPFDKLLNFEAGR